MRNARRLSIGAIGLLLLVPSAGQGQTADPDSPAGVEYELPLDRARDDANPGATRRPGGGSSGREGRGSGLFGEGITAPREGQDGEAAGSGRPSAPTSREGKRTNGQSGRALARAGRAPRGPSEAGPAPERANAPAVATGNSGIGPTIAVVAAIVLLGLAGGFALRRVLRGSAA